MGHSVALCFCRMVGNSVLDRARVMVVGVQDCDGQDRFRWLAVHLAADDSHRLVGSWRWCGGDLTAVGRKLAVVWRNMAFTDCAR